jgi:exopolysaccharide biosynthesis polyprenyl glycosylphosphotransferase
MILAAFEATLQLLAVLGLFLVAPAPLTPRALLHVLAAAAFATAGTVAAFYYAGLYRARATRRRHLLGARLACSLLVCFGLFTLCFYYAHDIVPRGHPVADALFVVLMLGLVRAGWYATLRFPPFVPRVLLLGTGPLAQRVARELDAGPRARAAAAVLGRRPARDAFPLRFRYGGTLERLPRMLEALRPHRIVVALDEDARNVAEPTLLQARAAGVLIEDAIDVYERLTGKLAIESLPPRHLLYGHGFRRSWARRLSARVLSVTVAACGLVVCGPLMAVIAALIVLDSGRPVFFVAERAGCGSRCFRLRKFRTMRPAQGETSEWAGDNDGRITRVGRWLRAFRLDELPQFVNVLRGDMNLVGPRPHPVSNVALFTRHIPYYSLRASIPPGLTGWAQVHYGYANNLDEETEKMRYDLYYLKHGSLWLDLRILLDTVKVVLFGRHADTRRRPRLADPVVVTNGTVRDVA